MNTEHETGASGANGEHGGRSRRRGTGRVQEAGQVGQVRGDPDRAAHQARRAAAHVGEGYDATKQAHGERSDTERRDSAQSRAQAESHSESDSEDEDDTEDGRRDHARVSGRGTDGGSAAFHQMTGQR